eukprot:TRINITY_DN456_c0_g1_i1.p2 TRINITY_DN456_c0_g1~~TRINITY_DN456_c0_g1_i1.p2  ORF type:complete len:107 (-),score=33.96 TRINITY_DN456_c0_g1_i1:124-444(-)
MAIPSDAQLEQYIDSVLNLPAEQVAEFRPMFNGKSLNEIIEMARQEGSMFDLWCDTIGVEQPVAEEAAKAYCRRDAAFREKYNRSVQMWTDEPIKYAADGCLPWDD